MLDLSVITHNFKFLIVQGFLGIGRRAVPSPKGKTRHRDIDTIIHD